ncbi:class D beta-lactamase [Thiohalocapsa marina]|uniref:Class D beta-lactamase n=1 Tax=Thiohalocapsa marina TaxID=424902 RepID=A0A5M8FCZ7_9GAMM|nr:class D beta-lactamase [Thiohalocapsa marina]KAA6181770.1 class D beta-lactamase [Thiohalocapsa marina]
MPYPIGLLILLCCAGLAQAEDAAIAQLFNSAGVDGTLVIESVSSGERAVHNDARAEQAFIAASTFKVFNTLIAVEEGAIASADDTLHWDGTEHAFPDWNRDQTLATAFKVSCVWCYQELARRVGAETYPAYLRLAGFGQLREPFDGSRFWMDGALTISAEQQVAFLKQVVQRRLPFRASTYETLATIMLADATPDHRLYAKTGWSTRSTPGIGWYVGYVERAEDTWVFALNLDVHDASDLPLRRQLTLDALRAKGILPAE